MTARVFLPLALALGLVLGWSLWVRAPDSAAREVAGAVERPVEAEILARLRRMEASLAQLTGAGMAPAPAAAPSALAAPSEREERRAEERRAEERGLPALTATDLAPLEEQLAALARAVEALQAAERSSAPVAHFPSLELLRSAGDVNLDQLGILIELHRQKRDEDMAALVRWKSQEEVLATYGRPETIDAQGNWYYEHRGLNYSVRFQFVADYVVNVLL